MFLRTEQRPLTRLLGIKLRTSPSKNQTAELWRSFIPRLKEIKNRTNEELISMQKFEAGLTLDNFGPDTEFEKWAAVEVRDFENCPVGLEQYSLTGGLYAVFLHKGTIADFANTQHFIYKQWLPKSEFEVDEREHFDIMGSNYKNNSPDSEEEIWVPVKKRQ